MTFNIGWKTITTIKLFNNDFKITVKLKAFGEQNITEEQYKACEEFCNNKIAILQKIEGMLRAYGNENNFIPTTLLFQRNGEYVLLLNDKQDEDGGIVACIKPDDGILMQDQYL